MVWTGSPSAAVPQRSIPRGGTVDPRGTARENRESHLLSTVAAKFQAAGVVVADDEGIQDRGTVWSISGGSRIPCCSSKLDFLPVSGSSARLIRRIPALCDQPYSPSSRTAAEPASSSEARSVLPSMRGQLGATLGQGPRHEIDVVELQHVNGIVDQRMVRQLPASLKSLKRRPFARLRAWLVARQLSLRAVLWTTAAMAFVLSPLLDNLTTALVMGALPH